jgi:hypothetical protein
MAKIPTQIYRDPRLLRARRVQISEIDHRGMERGLVIPRPLEIEITRTEATDPAVRGTTLPDDKPIDPIPSIIEDGRRGTGDSPPHLDPSRTPMDLFQFSTDVS